MIKGVLTTAAAMAVTVAAAGVAPAATNLLVNGSFETGPYGTPGVFGGWTYTGNEAQPGSPYANPATVITYGPPGTPYPTGAYGEAVPIDNNASNPGLDPVGTHAAYFVSDFAIAETLSQAVTLTPGNDYTFGFDVYLPFNGYNNPNGGTLTASLNGVSFATFDARDLLPGIWYTFSGSTTVGAISPTSFEFTFNSQGFPSQDFVVDRVYLTATASLVPEPASWALMVAGFGLMGAAMRRKRATVLFA